MATFRIVSLCAGEKWGLRSPSYWQAAASVGRNNTPPQRGRGRVRPRGLYRQASAERRILLVVRMKVGGDIALFALDNQRHATQY